MNIKTEIKDYLRSPDNCGALLLTGQWGSGKPYLVGEIIRELAKEDSYAFAMISLFGILVSSIAMNSWNCYVNCMPSEKINSLFPVMLATLYLRMVWIYVGKNFGITPYKNPNNEIMLKPMKSTKKLSRYIKA